FSLTKGTSGWSLKFRVLSLRFKVLSSKLETRNILFSPEWAGFSSPQVIDLRQKPPAGPCLKGRT
ncbi:MAG: hypothetical protein LBU62_06750, partial [Bacteroidales bacterium]|nr:hypothetical protein [Bacteroidales bacterium]